MTSEFVELQIRLLSTVEGGKSIPIRIDPVRPGQYRPHLRTAPTGEYLGVAFVAGPESIPPGMTCVVVAALIYVEHGVDYQPLQPDTPIEVLEGRTVVARGTVQRRWSESRHWSDAPSA